jgi:hypothetical protein
MATLDSFYQGLMSSIGAPARPAVPRAPFVPPGAYGALGMPGMLPVGEEMPMAAPPLMPEMPGDPRMPRVPRPPRMRMPAMPTGFEGFTQGYLGRPPQSAYRLDTGNAYGRLGQAARQIGGASGPGYGFGRVGRTLGTPQRGGGFEQRPGSLAGRRVGWQGQSQPPGHFRRRADGGMNAPRRRMGLARRRMMP